MLFIFLLLLIGLLVGRSAKPAVFHKSRSEVLKAFFPYAIILGHISFQTENPVILDFRYAGVYAVGLFFFMSGYGLECKNINNGIQFKKLSGRIRHLLVPLILPLLLYLIVAYVKEISLTALLSHSIATFSLILPFTWFVLVLLLLYIGYYFLRERFPDNHIFNGAMLVYLFALMVIFHLLGYDGTLYECNFCFLIGSIYRQNENSIIRRVENFIGGGKFCVAIALFILLLITLSYVSQKPLFRGFGLIGVSIYVFMFMIVYSYMEIKSNVLISFLQKISYPVYLCQGIVFLLLGKNVGNNIFAYSLLVILFDLAIASLSFYLTQRFRLH